MRKLNSAILLLAGLAVAAVAKEATPPPAIEALDEITVTTEKERQRKIGRVENLKDNYILKAELVDGIVRFRLTLSDIRLWEVKFRRESVARQLSPETALSRNPSRRAKLSGVRLFTEGLDPFTTALLTLDANVVETDGLPAVIPFGSHSSLVNLDYLRLRDTQGNTSIDVSNAIYPQTRRCESQFMLLDEGSDFPNRFVLLSDSLAECKRAEKGRENDLLFADSVPEKLRLDLMEVYGPIAVRIANRLGSEPGQVFVAWLPDSPQVGLQLERSWNRNNLLLFNGPGWQEGLDLQQQLALQILFTSEQIQRRIRQLDWPGAYTESAASYLQTLITAEQAGNTSRQLAEDLPDWIGNCARRLALRKPTSSEQVVPNYDCGLVVQFVYDAVARARSKGRETLYDTWRRLLNASYRRGESGANPWEFLASSAEARRLVEPVLDGTVDWDKFTTALDSLGVGLRIDQETAKPTVTVLSLTHFKD